MELTVSVTSVLRGSSPTFTVRMPRDITTGYVGFYDDQIPGPDKGIGTADLHDGAATLTRPTRTLPEGLNAIHASYGGEEDKYAPNDSNVVTVMVGVACRREPMVPDPPPGGAVFARPIRDNVSGPNVVVIDAGATWKTNSCPGQNEDDVSEVMTHPRAIQVGDGGAVVLRDQTKARASAWGARNVSFDDPAPVLYPQDSSAWTTTNAQAVTRSACSITPTAVRTARCPVPVSRPCRAPRWCRGVMAGI
jgi:Bacterial Ig-like domain (group 3)